MKLVKDTSKAESNKDQITDLQAAEAFKTILKWIEKTPIERGCSKLPKELLKHLKNILKGTTKIRQKNLKKLLVM